MPAETTRNSESTAYNKYVMTILKELDTTFFLEKKHRI